MKTTPVVTGFGACSSAGPSNDEFRAALNAGGGTFEALPEPLQLLPPSFGGVATRAIKIIRTLPGTRPLRPSTMTRYSFLSTIGLGLALADGDVDVEPDDEAAIRRGLFLGSYVNLPDMNKYVGMSYLVRDRAHSASGEYVVDDAKVMQGLKRFTGFEFLRLMNNMPLAHGSIQSRAKGPCNTFMGFCNAGLQAIGAGIRALEDGSCDTALCGGAGSAVIEHALLFKNYRGLMSTSDDPATACRPFCTDASGLVPGEGAAFLALETEEAARKRGATPRARVTGYATGYATPAGPRGLPVDHTNMAGVLQACLDDAGLQATDIDLLVPTGYGLPAMDALELAAHRQAFGDHLDRMQVRCHTPVTGFTEAAHGSLGVAAALCAMDGTVTDGWQPGAAIDGYPTATDLSRPVRRALVTGFSMEGNASAVILEGME